MADLIYIYYLLPFHTLSRQQWCKQCPERKTIEVNLNLLCIRINITFPGKHDSSVKIELKKTTKMSFLSKKKKVQEKGGGFKSDTKNCGAFIVIIWRKNKQLQNLEIFRKFNKIRTMTKRKKLRYKKEGLVLLVFE